MCLYVHGLAQLDKTTLKTLQTERVNVLKCFGRKSFGANMKRDIVLQLCNYTILIFNIEIYNTKLWYMTKFPFSENHIISLYVCIGLVD